MADFWLLGWKVIIQLQPSSNTNDLVITHFTIHSFSYVRIIYRFPILFGWAVVFQCNLPLKREAICGGGLAVDGDGVAVGGSGGEPAGGEEGEEGGPGDGGHVAGPAAEEVAVEPHGGGAHPEAPPDGPEVDPVIDRRDEEVDSGSGGVRGSGEDELDGS